MLSVSLGHETVAVIAVVSAFFIGLTAGAFALGAMIRRSSRPHFWFFSLECAIACWAIALIFIVPAYNQWMPGLIGAQPSVLQHWALAFTGSFLVLLPATAAMGATLPAMERAMAGLWRKPDRVAGLYACNTLGAVIGTLGATFYLIPQFGLTTTLLLLAAINVICATGILLACDVKARVDSPVIPKTIDATNNDCFGAGNPRLRLSETGEFRFGRIHFTVILFFTGLLGIGYEILVIRVLSQILENTVYTFAVVLSVYLMGTALGSALYQRTWARQKMFARQWEARLDILVAAATTACLLGVLALWVCNSLYATVWQGLGRGFMPALLGEFAVGAVAFLLPTIVMGALFSHLVQKATQTIGLGAALGANTLGAAFAPIVFGVMILPLTGAKVALLLIGTSYLLLLSNTGIRARRLAIAPVSLAILIAFSPLQLRFVNVPESDRLLVYREGVMATLAVVEQENGHRFLKVNNHFTMGGTASRYSDHRQTHIPLLLHGSPRSVLYLGIGTGITFDAARFYHQTKAVGVELIPESLSLVSYFGVNPDDGQWQVAPQLMAGDARRYVLSGDRQFDVIIGEIFHPARDGAGSLYTVEHFSAVKNRLADDGSFCQWLPLFQLDMLSLQTIVRTFVHVFPHARLYLGHYSVHQPILCLEGTLQARTYPQDWLRDRVNDRGLQNELVGLRLNSDFALLGGYLASKPELEHFAGMGPLNTDDHPLVTYQAPMLAYTDNEPPIVRLEKIIRSFADTRATVVEANVESRMEQYWRARDRFMLAAVALEQTAPEDWATSLKYHLLDVVRISGDFEPAYHTLLMMAQELYSRDRIASQEILDDLHAASPGHPEALALRNRLFGDMKDSQ